MKEFRLPDPGEGLVEAEIVRWVVAEGDEVKVNDIIVEIETSKSIVELPSPFAGRVARLLVQEGQTVEVGTPIIFIDDGSPTPAAEPSSAPAAESSAADQAPVGPAAEADSGTTEAFLVGYGVKSSALARRPRKHHAVHTVGPVADHVHESYAASQPVSRKIDEPTVTPRVTAEPVGDPLPPPGRPARPDPQSARAKAKPPVRRLARDLGLDLEALEGTGPDGTITAEDVVAAASASQGHVEASSPSPTAHSGEDVRVPLRGVRREMARSMTASLQIPQATCWVEAEMTETMRLVETLKKRPEFDGLRVSPLLIFAKAACLAIGKSPDINSSLDMEAEEIIQHPDVNLGIAAATPRGLLVPNIKQANRKNLVELAEALNNMVKTARAGKIQPADMAHGTFTITNVGVFGIDGGTPILNPGESAIMCLGTIARRPWVVGSGAQEHLEPRSVCTLTLTFDHRLVDGEIASRFLSDVATILANPGLALMY